MRQFAFHNDGVVGEEEEEKFELYEAQIKMADFFVDVLVCDLWVVRASRSGDVRHTPENPSKMYSNTLR